MQIRLEALEDRRLLSGISSITEFPIQNGLGPVPEQIVTGPDGNLWFSSAGGQNIGTINPTTGAITLIPLPGGSHDYSWAIAAGPDGNIWFSDWNSSSRDYQIAAINPTTHAISEFPVSFNVGDSPDNGITAGPDGNVWFTDHAANEIGMISPDTHVITQFALPSGSAPEGITAGPDGNVWFTVTGGSLIGEINPTTHAITEFATPTANAGPQVITPGPDGNLWFNEIDVSQIGEINPETGGITEYATPSPNSHPEGVTAGPDGNLWFSEEFAGKIGELNPVTRAVTEYAVPYASAEPVGITTGPDGNLWFTDDATKAIGLATLAPTQLIVTQQPPAILTAGSPFGLTVEDVDSSGNPVTSFSGTVTVGLINPPGGGTLGGTLSVTASNGVATFSGLTLDTAASGYTLLASGSGVGEAVAGAIAVTPATASQAVITSQPGSVTAGSGFALSTAIEDPYGNVVTSATNNVTVALASNPGGSTLGGTLSLTASNGVADFGGLTLDTAASGYTLQVSSAGLSGAVTSPFPVTAAAASQLVITQQPPSSVGVNSAFGLQAKIEDAYGNVVTTGSSTVKVALANNPTGAKLGGTQSVKSSQGVAVFAGLTLSKVGSGYTLQVSSNGLSGAVTGAIAVTNASSMSMLSTTGETGAPDALLAPLVIDSPDFLGTVGLKKRAATI